MFTYATVKDRPALLRVLTSLTPAEFAQLLIPFQAVWDEYVRQPPSDGTERQRAYGGGRKPVLERIDDKLFNYSSSSTISRLIVLSTNTLNI